MHARFYNPQLGRFLSTDPINSAKPRAPQSWNKYSYALNSPLKYLDPDGRTVVGFSGLFNAPGGVTEAIQSLQAFERSVGPAQRFRHQDGVLGLNFLYQNNGRGPNVVFGHGLGAHAALSTVRSASDIPIDLLLTVDAAPHPGVGLRVPANVALAVNFYQSGIDLGGARLFAEDPSRTRVVNIEAVGTTHTGIDEAVTAAIVGEVLSVASQRNGDLKLRQGLQFIQGQLVYVRSVPE